MIVRCVAGGQRGLLALLLEPMAMEKKDYMAVNLKNEVVVKTPGQYVHAAVRPTILAPTPAAPARCDKCSCCVPCGADFDSIAGPMTTGSPDSSSSSTT